LQRIDNLSARLAAIVNLERVAVRFVFHENPRATVVQRIGKNSQLLNAVSVVIDRANDREPCVERAQHFRKSDFVEEVDEQIGRSRATVDYEQVRGFRRSEYTIDFPAMFEIDELGFRMETLQRRVLVIAVDRAVFDAAIFKILNEIGREKALSNTAFAVDDEIDLFVHTKVR